MIFFNAANDCHWQSEFINESLDPTSRGIRLEESFLIFEFDVVWLMNSNTWACALPTSEPFLDRSTAEADRVLMNLEYILLVASLCGAIHPPY